MAGKREKPEDIVLKLRQVEVLQGQGKSIQEAVRQIGVTVQTYYRWRKERAMSAIGPRTMASAA
ncbi:Homeodomain-like domain-containing protein [Loktanella fryxellensis]|uniref:Homeodomain-like domain-containing protein n=1 Tax=Loktanella fryxellensis TaxID=245187 RepID=A0A1H8H2S7_9RHOB|nr:Homeodomain-like domain-containing protein [Loktanella fryxellensis]